MNNVFKRILVGVAVGFILYLIKGYILMDVSARTISMDVPDNFGYYTTNGQSTQNTLTSQQATLNNYVNIPSYRSQLIPQNSHGGLAYEWVNANLCVNDDLTISGVIHNPYITSVTWASGYFNSWTEQKSCDLFSVSNGYRFTCSGTGGGGFVVYFGYQNDELYGSYFYLERDMDIYCNATANDIIANANNNTSQIINNNIENTQNIMNNQNENTEKEIESQKVCNSKVLTYNDTDKGSHYLNSSGGFNNNSLWGVTDYLELNSLELNNLNVGSSTSFCTYNSSKVKLNCYVYSSQSVGIFNLSSDVKYVRFSIRTTDEPYIKVGMCKNGNQALNDSLTDDSVDTSGKDNYFTDFDDDNPLLTILMFPIELLQSANNSCSPITLTYLNHDIILPCGDTIFWNRNDVTTFRNWWNLFVGGIAIYFLGLNLFHIISDAVDPWKDDISKVGGF